MGFIAPEGETGPCVRLYTSMQLTFPFRYCFLFWYVCSIV